MKSKYLDKVYDGMWKVVSFNRKSTMYTLENIYNGHKISLSHKALKKVDDDLITVSKILSHNIDRHYDNRIKKECCICGKKFEGWGNNPAPIKTEGVCCDECNNNYVIPARLKLIYKS